MDNYQDKISTQEFFKSVFSYLTFLKSKWQYLLGALLLGTCFDLLTKSLLVEHNKYSGFIGFHLSLDGQAGGGQLQGLAGAMGFGGMQTTGGDLLGANNFEAIMKSISVYELALMKEITLNGKKELMINYFIDSSDIKQNEWKGNFLSGPSGFANYRFKKKSFEDFTPLDNMVLADVYNKLLAETRIEPREKTSLFFLHTTTTNELLTKKWLEVLLETTEEFYKEMKTKKTRQLLFQQERRLDSLAYLMKSNDKRLARATFDNPLVVDPTGQMRSQQLARDNAFLSNQYYTQLANVETLNRMIVEQTPIFTITEKIKLPLSQYKKVGLITRMSGLLALVAVIAILSIIRTYQNAFSEQTVA